MKYEWIGWCKEDNHDKVWGIIKLRDEDNETPALRWYKRRATVCIFWGRRGKKLQTKVTTDYVETLNKLISSKSKKGYKSISKENLDSVYPEFQTDLEQTAFWATLSI